MLSPITPGTVGKAFFYSNGLNEANPTAFSGIMKTAKSTYLFYFAGDDCDNQLSGTVWRLKGKSGADVEQFDGATYTRKKKRE